MVAASPPLSPADHDFLRRLARQRSRARAVLWFERLWPALWPPIGLVGLFLCTALLDLPQRLPAMTHTAFVAAFAIGIAALLWRGLSRLAVPSARDVDRRLEAASGLSHQPLAAIADRPAIADPAGAALWRVHLARTRARLGRLRAGSPHPGLAARDRMALRGGLLVALVASLVVAGPDAAERIGTALSTRLPALPGAPGTEIQAWITPPGYTGLPPVFLHAHAGRLSVPEGSHLTVSVTGGEGGAPRLLLGGGESGAFRALDTASWQADRTLSTDGRLAVRRRGREIAAWTIAIVPNTAPTVAFSAPPGQEPHGLLVRMPWKAHDQYGVTELRAELRLQGRPKAPPVLVPIPLPEGDAKSPHGLALRDLTAHPWAGLPVIATLFAKNAPGLEGQSASAAFTLPERTFTNPVARAVIAVRKMLSLHPEARVEADTALGAISPDAFAGDAGGYLNLAAIRALLRDNPDPPAVPEAQARMWTLALHLEEHQVEATARDLEAARQALRRTLDRAERTGHLDRKEFEQRLRALRDAIRKHLEALLQQAIRNGTETPFDANRRVMTQRDIDRMLQQLDRAARRGQMAEAEQQMAQLEQMLQALQNAQPLQGQQTRDAQQRRGQQQMGALQDLVGRQGGLLDHSEQRGAPGDSPNAPQPAPQQGAQAGAQPGGKPSNQAQSQAQNQAQNQAQGQARDARTQGALRRALGELMQEFGDLTGKIPPALGEADQAMQRAREALGRGQDGAAAAAQKQAIAALSKGGQQMGQQMAAQFGASPGQGQSGEGQQGAQIGRMDQNGQGGNYGMPGQNRGDAQLGPRDPLGRLTGEGNSGADEGNDVRIPTKSEQERVREIEQELRKRDGQMFRPPQERDYIQRLLRTY